MEIVTVTAPLAWLQIRNYTRFEEIEFLHLSFRFGCWNVSRSLGSLHFGLSCIYCLAIKFKK